MPSNPNQETNTCYKWIDNFLMKTLPKKGLSKKDIIRQTLILFSVSERTILHFIEEYYIGTGLVIEKEEKLFPKEV